MTDSRHCKANRPIGWWLIFVAATLIISFSACNKAPDGVLDKERMARLLADLNMGEAVIDFNYADFPNDSVRMAFRQSIYMANGVTQQEVDSSFMWYGHHIEDYIKVCNRSIEILNERKSEYAHISGHIAVAGDSVAVWVGPGHASIGPNAPSRFISFEIQPDSTWEKGDLYALQYKAINAQLPLKARLLVDYSDGVTSYSDELTRKSSLNIVKLQVDSTRNPQRVYGYIQIPNDDSFTYELDSIALTRMRKHLKRNSFYGSRYFAYGQDFSHAQSNDTLKNAESETRPVQENFQRPSHVTSITHEPHGSTTSKKTIPTSSSSLQTQTLHRKEATEHRITNHKENAELKRNAMPKKQKATKAK